MNRTLLATFFLTVTSLCIGNAQIATDEGRGADRDRVAERPYMGWTTWSQQSHQGDAFQNETNVKANSDAMRNSGLQEHGFRYINIDGDWDNGLLCECGPPITFDTYGRPVANVIRFPHGMKAIADYIHHNGQKAGIYWEPGVVFQVADANTPILGTSYHVQDILVKPLRYSNKFGASGAWAIDFSKPGAQEYVSSIVDLFASWGFDYVKLDGVGVGEITPRHGTPFYIDDRPDVQAFHKAIRESGRPIYLNLSWSLPHDYAAWWERWSNGRRIDGDIECYQCATTITDWPLVMTRFTDLLDWQTDAGPRRGWNDLDSLAVGNQTNTAYPSNSPEILQTSNPPSPPTSLAGQPALTDGLTNDERKTMMTFWSIAAAPLQLGDDMTILDSYGIELLTNQEVISVDQSGRTGKVITEGNTPVWAQSLCEGSYYVALFNLNDQPSSVTVTWINLGFKGEAEVRDLWAHQSLGSSDTSFTTELNAHASTLLKVMPLRESRERERHERGCEVSFR